MDTQKVINEFLANKAWIHITKENVNLVSQLQEMIPEFEYSSTRVLSHLGRKEEVWYRHQRTGTFFILTYPRVSTARTVSPWIYDHGPIYDIEDFFKDSDFVITEKELEELISS